MEKLFKSDTTNSKSRKYNIIKHSFEELLKVLPNSNVTSLLNKIFFIYHEIALGFSTENRELKEINQRLTNQIDKIKKMNSESLILKENENELLKKRISELTLNSDIVSTGIPISSGEVDSNKNCVSNGSFISNNNQIVANAENEKITRINKNNLDDLDALYFFDKVNMKKRSLSSNQVNVPLLHFNVTERKCQNVIMKKNNNINNNKNREKQINNVHIAKNTTSAFNIKKSN